MQLVDSSLNPIKQNRQLVPIIPNQSLLSPPSPTVSCLQPSTPSSNCYFQAPPQSGCPSSLPASIFSPGGACLPLSIQGAAGQLNSVSTAFSTDRSSIQASDPSELSFWSGYPASPRTPGTGRWMSSWRSSVRPCS